MDIGVFTQIGIIGAALSVFMEWLTQKYEVNSPAAKITVIGLSVAIGIVYWFLARNVELLKSVIGILASASTVYAIFYSGK
jgi:hypothetical protein